MNDPGRREFLTRTSATAAAALLLGQSRRAQAAALPTRTLGRTGLEVTTVSFGAIQLNNAGHERVLEHAIDQGMNLVHVSPGYQNGRAIEVVGAVMKRKRDKVFLALKEGPYPQNIERALQKLNTDYVDILVPPVTDPNAFGNERMAAGFAQMKQQGKARFSGFATHSNMAACLLAATAAGFWDVVLLSYSVESRAAQQEALAAAVKSGIGVLVMKGSQGLPRSNPEGFAAGLRNLLTYQGVHSLTLGMATLQHVDQNIAAVTQRDARADREFARYVASCQGRFCSGCHQCHEACPRGVAVDEYLRAWNYRQRGDYQLANELLAALPTRRSLAMCNACGRCDQACQQRLAVLERLREAAG